MVRKQEGDRCRLQRLIQVDQFDAFVGKLDRKILDVRLYHKDPSRYAST